MIVEAFVVQHFFEAVQMSTCERNDPLYDDGF